MAEEYRCVSKENSFRRRHEEFDLPRQAMMKKISHRSPFMVDKNNISISWLCR
jgi:hypothetical protein